MLDRTVWSLAGGRPCLISTSTPLAVVKRRAILVLCHNGLAERKISQMVVLPGPEAFSSPSVTRVVDRSGEEDWHNILAQQPLRTNSKATVAGSASRA